MFLFFAFQFQIVFDSETENYTRNIFKNAMGFRRVQMQYRM